MRGLFVVVAIVASGCYRPTSDPACAIACTQGLQDSCPSGLVCGSAGLCEASGGPSCNAVLDAQPDTNVNDDDADIDGPLPSICNMTSFPLAPQVLVSGYMITVSSAHHWISLYGSGEVKVNETVPSSGVPADYVTVVSVPPGAIEMYSGRIDPSGEVIYVSSDDGASMLETLVYASRRTFQSVWSNYELVTLRNAQGTVHPPGGLAMGASTDPALGARRFPLNKQNAFDEYVESAPDVVTTFDLVRTTTATQLGIEYLNNTSFAPDGLRMVFIGEVGTVMGIFTSTRASFTAPWETPVMLRNATSQDTYPYLTANCQELYWTNLGVGRFVSHL